MPNQPLIRTKWYRCWPALSVSDVKQWHVREQLAESIEHCGTVSNVTIVSAKKKQVKIFLMEWLQVWFFHRQKQKLLRIKTELKRCTMTESLWNRYNISRKSQEVPVKRSPKVVRKERALALNAPWDSTAIGWKIYELVRLVYFTSLRLAASIIFS